MPQWSDTTLSYLHVDDSHGRRNGLGGGPIIEEELVEELLLLQQAAQLTGEIRVRAVAQDLVLCAVDGVAMRKIVNAKGLPTST